MAEQNEFAAHGNSSVNIKEGIVPGATALLVISVVLFLCGVAANLSVCFVLVHRRRLTKSFANFHLFNLALTNLLFRTLLAPLVLQRKDLEMGIDALCKIQMFANFTTLAVVFALLAGISANQYFNIVHPFKARHVSWKHSRVFVILSWIYAAVWSTPLMLAFQYDYSHPKSPYKECVQKRGALTMASRTLFLIFGFLTPFVVICASNVFVMQVIRTRLKVNRSTGSQARVARSKAKTLKMIIVVALSYVLIWSPKLLWFVLEAYGVTPDKRASAVSEDSAHHAGPELNEWKFKGTFYEALVVITYSSSILNPLIFGYYSQNFREGFRQLYKKLCSTKGSLSLPGRFKNKTGQKPEAYYEVRMGPMRRDGKLETMM